MKARCVIPAALFGAAALFVEELYRFTFCRESSPILGPILDKKGHEEAYYLVRDAASDALRNMPCERLHIRSSRGEMLTGFYYPGSGKGKRIAFLVHGYRSEHAETAGLYVDCYERLGFDLFCLDQTAHGESEGRFIGFDVFEADDCLRWIDELRRHFGEDVQIILHGFSMGGATVLKAAPEVSPQVKFIVDDCGYADAEKQLKSSLGPLYPLLRAINRVVAGYDLADTDVRPGLLKARVPILFVHGMQDPTVPFENGKQLYALYQGAKDRLFVENARHVESMYRAPADYENMLAAFIRTYIEPSSF
ncbi:MAG: alpha/beta fold hydrolase [Oscillospiraceae bacterium]|nr:alpha/beta fold hydrolase [Oscillospiraceae bacterium]